MARKHAWFLVVPVIVAAAGLLAGLFLTDTGSYTRADASPRNAETGPVGESASASNEPALQSSAPPGADSGGGSAAAPRGIDTRPLPPAFRRFYDVLRNNGDVRALVDEWLPMAENGNAEAQFLISQALLYCDMFFKDERVRNEGYWESRKAQLREKGWSRRDFSSMDDGIAACRGFWEVSDLSRYRSKGYWLKRARASGYGPALAFGAAWSGMLIDAGDGTAAESERDVARALKSRHPAALGHAAGALVAVERFPVAPRLPEADRYIATMIVACRNGLPCGRDSFHWRNGVATDCPHCESLPDVFEYNISAARFREIREAADAIERAIAREDWGALGLAADD